MRKPCSDAMATKEHGSIEQYIDEEGRELLRLMLQAALDPIAENEVKLPHVTNSNGHQLSHVRKVTSRKLTSLFGPVLYAGWATAFRTREVSFLRMPA